MRPGLPAATNAVSARQAALPDGLDAAGASRDLAGFRFQRGIPHAPHRLRRPKRLLTVGISLIEIEGGLLMKRRLGIILGIVILVVLVALLFIVPAITGGETAEGNWELTSAVIDDVTVSDTSTLDFELFLLLNADGTGTLTFSQGDAACTWRQHGATVTVVTEDREPQPFTLEEDGTLTWVTEDMTFILSRMDDAAAANAPGALGKRRGRIGTRLERTAFRGFGGR